MMTILLNLLMPEDRKNPNAVALRRLRTLKLFGKLTRRRGALQKKNRHAIALALLGASKGGKTSSANMTRKQRQERAINAALIRWGKKTGAAKPGLESP